MKFIVWKQYFFKVYEILGPSGFLNRHFFPKNHFFLCLGRKSDQSDSYIIVRAHQLTKIWRKTMTQNDSFPKHLVVILYVVVVLLIFTLMTQE